MNKSWHPQTYMNVLSLIAKGYINDLLDILNIGLYFFLLDFFGTRVTHYIMFSYLAMRTKHIFVCKMDHSSLFVIKIAISQRVSGKSSKGARKDVSLNFMLRRLHCPSQPFRFGLQNPSEFVVNAVPHILQGMGFSLMRCWFSDEGRFCIRQHLL